MVLRDLWASVRNYHLLFPTLPAVDSRSGLSSRPLLLLQAVIVLQVAEQRIIALYAAFAAERRAIVPEVLGPLWHASLFAKLRIGVRGQSPDLTGVLLSRGALNPSRPNSELPAGVRSPVGTRLDRGTARVFSRRPHVR